MSVGVISPHVQSVRKVRDLIYRAYVIAHVLGEGETISLPKASKAFEQLNDLIEQATLEKTFSMYQTEVVVPLESGTVSYTIGPQTASPPATVVAPRPVEVLSGFTRRQGQDVPVYVTHAKEDYDRIWNKSLIGAGWLWAAYYQATYPSGTIYVYPVPMDTDTSLHLTVLANVDAFVSLDEEVDLPPGYSQYLKYALAHRVCADFGMKFGEENQAILARCESALTNNNMKPFPVSTTEVASLQTTGYGYRIQSDSFRGR